MASNLFMILTVICIAVLVQENRNCRENINQLNIKIMQVENGMIQRNTRAFEKLHEMLNLMERMHNTTRGIFQLFDQIENKVDKIEKQRKAINNCLNLS